VQQPVNILVSAQALRANSEKMEGIWQLIAAELDQVARGRGEPFRNQEVRLRLVSSDGQALMQLDVRDQRAWTDVLVEMPACSRLKREAEQWTDEVVFSAALHVLRFSVAHVHVKIEWPEDYDTMLSRLNSLLARRRSDAQEKNDEEEGKSDEEEGESDEVRSRKVPLRLPLRRLSHGRVRLLAWSSEDEDEEVLDAEEESDPAESAEEERDPAESDYEEEGDSDEVLSDKAICISDDVYRQWLTEAEAAVFLLHMCLILHAFCTHHLFAPAHADDDSTHGSN
jgi:hypothetical protein